RFSPKSAFWPCKYRSRCTLGGVLACAANDQEWSSRTGRVAGVTAHASKGTIPDAAFMRSPRELLLATRPFAHESLWRSWWAVGSTLGAALVLFSMAIGSGPWWARIAASGLLGMVIVRSFVLFHDFQHGAILRGSRLANGILGGFGLLMLNP